MEESIEQLVPNTRIEEGETKQVAVDPRVMVISFPKSGTHLLEQLIQPFVYPMPADKPWAGTFRGHSWTTIAGPIKRTLTRIGYIRDGTYAKGHLGYSEMLENYLYGIGAAALFIYRDPRDVALSLTYHILNDQPHGRNEWYKEIGFDAALLGVIKGIGPYAGVMERWNYYAGWLEASWVLSVEYSDLLANRREWAEKIMRYIVGHCAGIRGFGATIDEADLERYTDIMVESSLDTGKSPTFRKGVSGGWREEFKAAHVMAFHDTDVKWAEEYGLDEPWLVHLGFEEEKTWWQEYVKTDEEEGEEWLTSDKGSKSDQTEQQTSDG